MGAAGFAGVGRLGSKDVQTKEGGRWSFDCLDGGTHRRMDSERRRKGTSGAGAARLERIENLPPACRKKNKILSCRGSFPTRGLGWAGESNKVVFRTSLHNEAEGGRGQWWGPILIGPNRRFPCLDCDAENSPGPHRWAFAVDVWTGQTVMEI